MITDFFSRRFITVGVSAAHMFTYLPPLTFSGLGRLARTLASPPRCQPFMDAQVVAAPALYASFHFCRPSTAFKANSTSSRRIWVEFMMTMTIFVEIQSISGQILSTVVDIATLRRSQIERYVLHSYLSSRF